MNQYIIFSGAIFYPGGGMIDFHKSFIFLEDAEKEFNKHWEVSKDKDIGNGFWISLFDTIQMKELIRKTTN